VWPHLGGNDTILRFPSRSKTQLDYSRTHPTEGSHDAPLSCSGCAKQRPRHTIAGDRSYRRGVLEAGLQVRAQWNIALEDAADFTQEFFTRLREKEFLDSYDSGKGRLRTFYEPVPTIFL
jgi:hypothetical protein